MSVLVWAMVGIALWHFAVLVPDRFRGGIIGAVMAALLGALSLRTGLQAARELARRRPELRILMLSMHDVEDYCFQALKAGASGTSSRPSPIASSSTRAGRRCAVSRSCRHRRSGP
jgi:DNA-binding NarL/FixJ family response regulator